MRKLLQQQKGLTLTELLVMVAILGILAAVMVGIMMDLPSTLSNNTTTPDSYIEAASRVIIGQVTAIDSQGQWTYLYFHEGPKVPITTKSLALVASGTDPFHNIYTYRIDGTTLIEVIGANS